MHASLIMFKSDGERREFPLTKAVTVIGRKNTCDLRIPLSSVSRQHFKIERDGDKLTLRDLGSSNGTYYNNERVLEAQLEPGDQLRVGPVTFVVVIDGRPADIQPIRTVLPRDTGEVEVPAEVQADAIKKIDKGHEMPHKVDEEAFTPTVQMDDEDEDPIAALEALAAAEDDDESDSIPLIDDQPKTKKTK
ncbi:MAG: FHA domain-containing protein [Phycisphaeraceae bacterium]